MEFGTQHSINQVWWFHAVTLKFRCQQGVQDHPQLHSESEAGLGNLKTNKITNSILDVKSVTNMQS